MFFKKAGKSDEILHYSHYFIENFNTSALKFYDAVEKELISRKVPDLELSRIRWAEGGFISANREYLRLARERLIFDICAAPFGTSFFFSCRLVELPPPINPFALAIVVLLLFLFVRSVFQAFGFVDGLTLLVITFAVLVWILRNPIAVGLTKLDSTLMQIPLIGPLYERFLRKETYYRHDTRVMYLETVPMVVKRLVEDLTAAKGVTLSDRIEGKTELSRLGI
jgi:hypothetical protein